MLGNLLINLNLLTSFVLKFGSDLNLSYAYWSEIQSKSHTSEFFTLIFDYHQISECELNLLRDSQYY